MQNKVIFDNNYNMTFKSYVSKVFGYVGCGLLISAISAFVSRNFIFSFGLVGTFLPIILEFVIAIYFSKRIMTMSKGTAYGCFALYSVVTGISLSYIFIVFNVADITFAFVSTTVLFVCMSIIGNNTNFDLTKISNYLYIGLIGILISTLLNFLIFKSTSFDLFVSYIAVVIFLGLIAYDMQMLRNLYNNGLSDGDLYDKLLIFGSFRLYLDFINLFLRILQVFSRRRD